MINRQVLFNESQINARLSELAALVVSDFGNEPITLISVLTGGFMVLADFSRALYKAGKTDIEIEFIRTTSYIEDNNESRTQPKIISDLNRKITGKNILIVEDIADTGYTLKLLQDHFRAENPKKMRTLTLLNKPSNRKVEIELDYFGFEVDGWIEGYGLDSIRACPSVMERITSKDY